MKSKSSRPAGSVGAHSRCSATPDAKRWAKVLAPYGVPDPKRSVFELLVTAVPFLLLWALMLYCLEVFGYWATVPLTLPAAGFLVRLFMIQHDCGHGSFSRWRSANDWIGRIIGVLTLTPYDYWRRTHAVHHATTGNLDRRGTGDVTLLTVAEYRSLPRWRRIAYRLSRNPLVLLGLGPLYLFVLKYRLPVGLIRDGKGVWISAMSTNLAIAGIVAGMCALVGVRDFLLVQVPITLLAGSAGVWLFYVQHQFEDTSWERQGAWSLHVGALQGATHYDLPAALRWLTANIGIHHVHHLASRIPSYRLREVLADHPELREVGRLTLRQSLACFRLALWNEESRKLVALRDLRGSRTTTPPTLCLAAVREVDETSEGKEERTVTQAGSTVGIQYTFTLEDGTTVESNVGQETLRLEQGFARIIPGLDKELIGMKVSETKRLTVTPEEGYGPLDSAAFVEVPVGDLPEDAREPGKELMSRDAQGRTRSLRVHSVEGDTATLDFNHSLAGRTLIFDFKILEIR